MLRRTALLAPLALVLPLALLPAASSAAEPPEPSVVQDESPDLPPGWTSEERVQQLPKDLRKALKKGVKLLEKGELVAFLERFLHPDDRRNMPSIEQVAEGFAGDKAEAVRQAFEVAEQVPAWRVRGPEGESAYVLAVTRVVSAVPRDMVVEKVDGTWRIRN